MYRCASLCRATRTPTRSTVSLARRKQQLTAAIDAPRALHRKLVGVHDAARPLRVPPDESAVARREEEARVWVSAAQRCATWTEAAAVLREVVLLHRHHRRGNGTAPTHRPHPAALDAATSALATGRALAAMGARGSRAALALALGDENAVDGERVSHWPLESEEALAVLREHLWSRERRALLVAEVAEVAAEHHNGPDDRLVHGALNALQGGDEEGGGGGVSITALLNLSQLRLSWHTAMRLISEASFRGLAPVPALYEEVIVRARAARRWREALTAFADCVARGMDPTADSVAFACATLADEANFAFTQFRALGRRQRVWDAALFVWRAAAAAEAAGELQIAGERGVAVLEQSVLLAAAMRRWDLALRFVASMDLDPRFPTHRALLPTGDTLLHALACCIAANRAQHAELLLAAVDTHRAMGEASPRARVALFLSATALPRRTPHRFELIEKIVVLALGSSASAEIAPEKGGHGGASEDHVEPAPGGKGVLLTHRELDSVGALLQASSRRVFAGSVERPSRVWELATRAFVAREYLPDALQPPQTLDELLRRLNGAATFARAMEGHLPAVTAFIEYHRAVHQALPLADVFFVPVLLRAAARALDWRLAVRCFTDIATHPHRHALMASQRAVAERVLWSFADTSPDALRALAAARGSVPGEGPASGAWGTLPLPLEIRGPLAAPPCVPRLHSTEFAMKMRAVHRQLCGARIVMARSGGSGGGSSTASIASDVSDAIDEDDAMRDAADASPFPAIAAATADGKGERESLQETLVGLDPVAATTFVRSGLWVSALRSYAAGPTADPLRPSASGSQARHIGWLLSVVDRLVTLEFERQQPQLLTEGEGGGDGDQGRGSGTSGGYTPSPGLRGELTERRLIDAHPRLFRAWASGCQGLRFGPLLVEFL